MTNTEPFIKIVDVSKEFDGKEVLKHVNFEINEGEALGLLGRSGAGKSALLHMLRGTEEYAPTRGEVFFRLAVCPNYLNQEDSPEGAHPALGSIEPPSKVGSVCPRCGSTLELHEVNYWQDAEARKKVKKRVAIMLQRTFGLYGEDTVMYNVLQALESRNYPVEQRFRRAYELLKAVKMIHRVSFPAMDLSGGEKQRVVLARQLALDPFLLLADEPTGTLDIKTGKLVHKALLDGTKGGMSLVVTSHWPSVIEELTAKALWLDHGEIIAHGDSKSVVAEFEKQVGKSERAEQVQLGEPKIRIEHCKKYYYSVWRGMVKAVDDVSLTIYENEIFGLIGLSGAGKTSLARIISQVDPLTDGSIQIRVGDRWIEVGRVAELGVWMSWAAKTEGAGEHIATRVAMLHQEFSLYPEKNILENLTSCIGLTLPAELGKMKAKYMLQSVGFTETEAAEVLLRMHTELSVGERQRIALAQVLMKEPSIAILDEPTGTMDPITKKYASDSIRAARENLGMTFLIVSHDLDFAYLVCDRIAHMQDGKVVKLEELRTTNNPG